MTAKGISTETPAILVFIAQRFPQSDLAPLDDAFALARVQAFNSYLCSTVHVAHAIAYAVIVGWMPMIPTSITAMKKKVPQNVAECFDLIEHEMFIGPWVMGDKYTICDPYLFTLVQRLENDGVDPVWFPRIQGHRQRMSGRRCVRTALAQELG